MWPTARKLTLTAAAALLAAATPLFAVQECTGTGNGGRVLLRVVDSDVDWRTGLITASRDTTGLSTSFTYDDMGRITSVRPQEDAWTVYSYARATAATAARVAVARQNAGSSVKLTEQRMVFDGFGRVCVTQERLPSGTWNRQDTLYWATGWKKEQSVVYETSGLPLQCRSAITTVPKTSFNDYDALGRVGEIVPPGGATHKVTFAYAGAGAILESDLIQPNLFIVEGDSRSAYCKHCELKSGDVNESAEVIRVPWLYGPDVGHASCRSRSGDDR